MCIEQEQNRHQSPSGVNGSEMQRLRSLAESSVWTERMLTALEQGVKGGKWHSLIDKVWKSANLRASFARVLRNNGSAGVDRMTCEQFAARLDVHVDWLERMLQEDRYVPQPVKRTWIPKPGRKEKRPLGIPTVRDRTVQGALRNVLEPIFEHDFAEHSYGFRPGRGCKDALRRVAQLLSAGFTWVIDADLKSYFDTIPHDQLLAQIGRKVSDRRILALVEAYLRQPILDDVKCWTPEEGTPQGAVLSPLLANIYLDPLDHLVADAGFEMVRYADDFVILCRSQAAAEAALVLVRQWTDAAGLILHPDKTRLLDASQRGGFDFLGYHFERGRHWPSPKACRQLRDRIRPLTKRTNGTSLETIVSRLNPILSGWFEYFKHGNWYDLPKLDGWVRMRLRSILRKRRKRKGRGRGRDHQRWPAAFFADLGLISLLTAHKNACQSARR
jgi:RNA-directed DNA polymerase